MKAISNGKVKTYQIKCDCCEAMLEYTKSEVRNGGFVHNNNEKSYEVYEYSYIFCPICDHTIIIDGDEIVKKCSSKNSTQRIEDLKKRGEWIDE